MAGYNFDISVVIGVDAELDESLSDDDVIQTEDVIVSHWRQFSASDSAKHHLRDQVDEILRPLGMRTRLLVMERANSIVLYFICVMLSAFTSLRDQWTSGQLKDIIHALFAVLSGAAGRVAVKRLTWPQADYEQSLEFLSSLEGK